MALADLRLRRGVDQPCWWALQDQCPDLDDDAFEPACASDADVIDEKNVINEAIDVSGTGTRTESLPHAFYNCKFCPIKRPSMPATGHRSTRMNACGGASCS